MARDPGEESLFDEAVTHAIRLQANPQSPAALAALAGWRARSPRHERLWQEAAEIHGMTGTLLAPEGRARGASRRQVLGLGAAGLGLLGGASLFGPGLITAARADHLTSTAEIEEVSLPDGTRLTLGPDSAFALAPAAQGRGLTLLDGMVYCEIAQDPGLPFRLACGPTTLLTDGAALNLSVEGSLLSLALDRGEAMVAAGPHAGTALRAGDWLTLGEEGAPRRRTALAASEASAWRQGLVVVEAEPLAAVVARLARWIPGRVVIAEPGLGERLISGVFDTARPREALLAAVSPHGAGLRRISPWLTIVTSL